MEHSTSRVNAVAGAAASGVCAPQGLSLLPPLGRAVVCVECVALRLDAAEWAVECNTLNTGQMDMLTNTSIELVVVLVAGFVCKFTAYLYALSHLDRIA